MTKKLKKGFTLIELIVVMAVFSILMVGIMALTGPVSRLFKNTAIAEKTYSYANNIQVYLQEKLEYSESIVLGTSDKMDTDSNGEVSSAEIAKVVEDFRMDHFENTVGSINGTDVKYLKGKIHVIRLLNSDDPSNTSFERGQITHTVYSFDSDKAIDPINNLYQSETIELNPAYFKAGDSAYNFNYAFGASKFASVSTPTGGDDKVTYRALSNDINDSSSNVTPTTLALSIVIDKKSNGSIDVPAGAGANAYRAFATPSALQIATLPLTNISNRSGRSATPSGLARPKKGPTDLTVKYQGGSEMGRGFDMNLADPKVNFSNDIYFIFSYTDEIGV